MNATLLKDEVALLKSGRHDNPHRFLGLHDVAGGEKVIRLWAPYQKELTFEYLGELVEEETQTLRRNPFVHSICNTPLFQAM